MIDSHKHERDAIRSEIRQRRRSLTQDALHVAGNALLEQCKPFLENANSVAGYNAMQGEIPLDPIFSYCQSNNITTLLPIMRDNALMFSPFDKTITYTKKQFGILEPEVPESQWCCAQQLDLVLVPLVAFDETCNRIGMGGGFYDRSFEFRKSAGSPPILLGVAHALQQVDCVYAQTWDVPLDGVATDKGLTLNRTQP